MTIDFIYDDFICVWFVCYRLDFVVFSTYLFFHSVNGILITIFNFTDKIEFDTYITKAQVWRKNCVENKLLSVRYIYSNLIESDVNVDG